VRNYFSKRIREYTKMDFEIPEKIQTGFRLRLAGEGILLSTPLQWTGSEVIPDIHIQKEIQNVQQTLLNALVERKDLFKTSPSLSSLQAITPVWGILVRSGNRLEWSPNDVWEIPPSFVSPKTVQLVLTGILLSRSSILPLWSLVETIKGVIDLFGEEEPISDVYSVGSDEVEEVEEESVFALRNAAARKREHKIYVRDLLRKAAEAQMAADSALDRFYSEFDLSDNESEFSGEENE
jgi:hypothetical protein